MLQLVYVLPNVTQLLLPMTPGSQLPTCWLAAVNMQLLKATASTPLPQLLQRLRLAHLPSFAPVLVGVEGEGDCEAEVGARVAHNIKLQGVRLWGDTQGWLERGSVIMAPGCYRVL